MKHLSGKYSEIEFVKSDSSQEVTNHDVERAVKLNSREWDQNVHKLAATFNTSSAAKDDETVPVGKLARCKKTRTVTTRQRWLTKPKTT